MEIIIFDIDPLRW